MTSASLKGWVSSAHTASPSSGVVVAATPAHRLLICGAAFDAQRAVRIALELVARSLFSLTRAERCFTSKATVSPRPGISACQAVTVCSPANSNGQAESRTRCTSNARRSVAEEQPSLMRVKQAFREVPAGGAGRPREERAASPCSTLDQSRSEKKARESWTAGSRSSRAAMGDWSKRCEAGPRAENSFVVGICCYKDYAAHGVLALSRTLPMVLMQEEPLPSRTYELSSGCGRPFDWELQRGSASIAGLRALVLLWGAVRRSVLEKARFDWQITCAPLSPGRKNQARYGNSPGSCSWFSLSTWTICLTKIVSSSCSYPCSRTLTVA